VQCKILGAFDNDYTEQALPLIRKIFGRKIYRGSYSAILEKATFIFELMSDTAGSGVIKHEGEPELILLGIRDHFDMELIERWSLKYIGKTLGVKVAELVDMDARDAIQKSMDDWDGEVEGWVGIDSNGTMFKVKFAEYVRAHRVSGGIRSPLRKYKRIIKFYWNYPDLASKWYNMDDILAIFNRSKERVIEKVEPYIKIDWSAIPRKEKKERLKELSKNYHTIIFGGEEAREEAIKKEALWEMDEDAPSDKC